MATPEVQNNQSANYGTATDQTENMVIAPAAEDYRLAGYMPSWWVLPAIGAAMLLAMLAIWLGLRYEQDAIAWSGIALFGLTTCVLLVAAVRYTRLLVIEISDWRRSTKRIP